LHPIRGGPPTHRQRGLAAEILRVGSGQDTETMCWDEISALVEQAKAGDRLAFGELVERFQGSVYAMAMSRVHDPLDAQELTQEVFIHAMWKLPQLREPRAFAGWLRKITARMAINRLTRKGPVFGAEPEMLDSVEGVVRGPLDEMELREAKANLHAALRRLKDDDRATLEAFYLRGRSLKQMAREFDAPVGTIKRRLHVARQRLKTVMVGSDVLVGVGEPGGQTAPRKRKKQHELCGV
ncbi:MAG: sigma-70 family RNA polymerase sigma factor, partial [Bacteroidales bacterium]|nr:sigma-70 family RNA polymerase sigma factor [Bacteroidales bacterium]